MNKNQFSPYFTFEELTDSDGHPELVEQNRVEANQYLLAGKRLSKLMESIRAVWGNKPVKANSGFRGKTLNTAIYVAIFMKQGLSRKESLKKAEERLSKHMIFEACDAKPPKGMTLDEAFDLLLQAHKAGLLPDLRKVLHEGAWLHIEVSMSAGDYRGFFVSHDGNKTFDKVA